jgi:hypothetical protein
LIAVVTRQMNKVADFGDSEKRTPKKEYATKVGVPREGTEKHLNGETWSLLAPLLTRYRSIRTLSEETNLPEEQVKEVLEQHAEEVRPSLLNAPSGEPLYIRRDTGLVPRMREVLAIAQLVAR